MKVLKKQQNVLANIKVEGERTMLKNVVLVPVQGEPGLFKVKTGRRGRPRLLAQEEIQKITVVGAPKTKEPVTAKKTTAKKPKRVVKVRKHTTAA